MSSSARARERLHVLVFDRDQGVLEVMRDTLAASGAKVSVASSVSEVVRLTAREHVDVVATDGMMAPAQRCELVIALKTAPSRRARETPVVRLRCGGAG